MKAIAQHIRLFGFGVCVATICAAPASASSKYTILDLGTRPGATSSTATSINEKNQVVGFYYDSTRPGQLWPDDATTSPGAGSFLYQQGTTSSVEALGGLARGINDRGQIVGGDNFGINNAGQYLTRDSAEVRVYPGDDPSGAYLDRNQFAFSPGFINNQGVVAGNQYVQPASPLYPGFLYYPAALKDGVMSYPGPVNPFDPRANPIYGSVVALNDRNDMVVTAHDTTNGKLTVSMTNLAGRTASSVTLSGLQGWQDSYNPYAMNNKGEVVGSGFLYDGSTLSKLVDLISPGSGWSDLTGLDINDSGWIVGAGTIDGQRRAFLMAPDGAIGVPEPTTVAVWALIGVGFAACRFRAATGSSRCRHAIPCAVGSPAGGSSTP